MPATRTKVNTPKVAADILASIDPTLDAAIKAAATTHKARGLKGADLARIAIDTGLRPDKGKGTKTAVAVVGLEIRTYMRSHGAWVGQGRSYGMTYAEARRIMAGFTASPQVAPPKGVRYAKGVQVAKVAPDATPAEVASA